MRALGFLSQAKDKLCGPLRVGTKKEEGARGCGRATGVTVTVGSKGGQVTRAPRSCAVDLMFDWNTSRVPLFLFFCFLPTPLFFFVCVKQLRPPPKRLGSG